jgi:hypothetical protein
MHRPREFSKTIAFVHIGVRRAAPSNFTQFLLVKEVGLPFGKLRAARECPLLDMAWKALGGYLEKVVERSPNVKTYQRRGHLIRGIAASEQFVDEITLLCLLIPLTNLDEPLKIGGIPKTKRKAADPLSAFTKAPDLPTAYPFHQG